MCSFSFHGDSLDDDRTLLFCTVDGNINISNERVLFVFLFFGRARTASDTTAKEEEESLRNKFLFFGDGTTTTLGGSVWEISRRTEMPLLMEIVDRSSRRGQIATTHVLCILYS